MSEHTLAEEVGIDTSVCELCGEPLDDRRPWRYGLDGSAAHKECLADWFAAEEEYG
jgi:hypothetical protein